MGRKNKQIAAESSKSDSKGDPGCVNAKCNWCSLKRTDGGVADKQKEKQVCNGLVQSILLLHLIVSLSS